MAGGGQAHLLRLRPEPVCERPRARLLLTIHSTGAVFFCVFFFAPLRGWQEVDVICRPERVHRGGCLMFPRFFFPITAGKNWVCCVLSVFCVCVVLFVSGQASQA